MKILPGVFGFAVVLSYLFGVRTEHSYAISPHPPCSSHYCLTRVDGDSF